MARGLDDEMTTRRQWDRKRPAWDFHNGDRGGAIDSRKVEELIEDVSCLQIVEDVPYRNPSGGERGHTATGSGMRVYDWFFHGSADAMRSQDPSYHSPGARQRNVVQRRRWAGLRCGDTMWAATRHAAVADRRAVRPCGA